LQPENNQRHFSPLPWHPDAIKNFHLEAPRKHAKSECAAINYPSGLIGNYPEINILIVSKTGDLAEATVAAIKNRIENDQRYINVFGDLKPRNPQKWADSEFFVKRKTISKFPTLRGCGMMGSLTGGGYDLIIADDIIDEENINTQLQLEKSSRWFFKVLLTTLFSGGGCFAIGTRWHYADLYSELLAKWQHRVYKAIDNYENVEKGEVPKVLWPQVWPYPRLMQKLDDIGTIYFNCQYQNDPTSMKGDLLKAEWLHPWEQLPSPNLPVYAGVDPSLGESDYFGVASFAFDRNLRQGYLLDVWAEHMPFPTILKEKLPQLCQTYRYQKIFMETNFWQKLLLGMPELSGLPIVPVQTVKNKEQRFIPMSAHFQSKRVLVNPLLLNQKSEFYRQWIQFPKAAHDDALDCVELVVSNTVGSSDRAPKVMHA
jgi:predicted phage terminase large subunit-like protein